MKIQMMWTLMMSRCSPLSTLLTMVLAMTSAGIVALGLGGCDALFVCSAPFQERGFKGFVADNIIRSKVNILLLKTKAWHRFDLLIHKGVVLLVGLAPSQEVKEDLLHHLQQVHGVVKVLDYIQVGQLMESYGQDVYLTQRFKTQCLATKGLRTGNYHFCCYNRILYLMGSAYTQEELDHLMAVAEGLPVRRVVSYMEIAESSTGGNVRGGTEQSSGQRQSSGVQSGIKSGVKKGYSSAEAAENQILEDEPMEEVAEIADPR